MSYNKAIPAAGDRLKDSQAQILENFATNSALLGVDHVISPWEDPADPTTTNQGKHNKVTMPEQTVAPNPVANEMALYTKEDGGVAQLFVRREGPGGTEINLTNDGLSAADGYTRLPNGLMIKWGTKSVTRNTLSAELTFDTTVAFTTVYTVNASQTFAAAPSTGDLNVAVSSGDITITGFKAFARAIGLPSGSTINIYYVAIGV